MAIVDFSEKYCCVLFLQDFTYDVVTLCIVIRANKAKAKSPEAAIGEIVTDLCQNLCGLVSLVTVLEQIFFHSKICIGVLHTSATSHNINPNSSKGSS